MHGSPVLRYSVARLVLFLAALGLLYLTGLRGLPVVVLALVVSGIASFWLLSAQRDAMSATLHQRVSRVRKDLDDGTAAEDAWDDDARRHPDG